MAGFATKLKLISEKFFQPSDGNLELSGNTQIADSGDLRYASHPNFTGDTQIIDKKYADDIAFNANTGITASTVYSLSTPSTVDVGGLDAGSQLTGFTSNELLEKILVATLYPTLTGPNVSDFTISGLASSYEVGLIQTWNSSVTFNRGSINPQYDATSPYRSGPANTYNYTGSGLTTTSSTSNTNTQTITDYTIQSGTNSWSVSVSYDSGVQPYDSKGNIYQSPLPAGTTNSVTRTTTGYYPYYWGVSSSSPTFGNVLINSADGNGDVEVANSDGTITINWGNNSGVYLWFAIPDISTDKKGWYVSDLNKGNIGDEPSDLFANEQVVNIDSPNNFWMGVDYKFYVTNGVTNTSSSAPMQLRNALQQ